MLQPQYIQPRCSVKALANRLLSCPEYEIQLLLEFHFQSLLLLRPQQHNRVGPAHMPNSFNLLSQSLLRIS